MGRRLLRGTTQIAAQTHGRLLPYIAGLRRNLFRKATGRHPKNLRAHPFSKAAALSVRGKTVIPINACRHIKL